MSGSSDADTFAERIFGASLGAADVLTMYLGDRLGYYSALAGSSGLTARELADRTATNARYAREWLEQQAVSGLLDVDDISADEEARRYSLSPAGAEVLTEPENLAAMAWLPRLIVAAAQALPKIADAFRTGGGVSWSDLGPDAIEGQGDQNRPLFKHLLAQEWIPKVPDLHAILTSGPSRIADVCCGVGLSAVAIAKAFPDTRVDGFDLDQASIELAKRNAEEAGVADRVSFEVRDAADPSHAGAYDGVMVFEAIHDLSDPVGVLRAMRALAKPDAPVIVMDENVAETFIAPGDEVERIMYAYSVLFCLPAGMAESPSAQTGTVMRPATLDRYAKDAGFGAAEVLDIDHPFFRFYRLR